MLNGDLEHVWRFNKTTTVTQNGISQIINHTDTFLFPGLIKKDFTRVNAAYWNYLEDSLAALEGNADYSNTGYANSGNVFIRINVWDKDYLPDEASVIHAVGKLCKKMMQGNQYRIKLHLKPFSGNHFTSNICVALSREKVPHVIGINKLTRQPLYNLPFEPAWCMEKILTDTSSYTCFEFVYTAMGGEEYLYIGNLMYEKDAFFTKQNFNATFEKTKQFGYWKNHQSKFMCIYAIDDVSVIPVDKNEPRCDTTNSAVVNEQKDSVLLALCYHEHDQIVSASCLEQLLLLQDTLEQYKSVLIIGHTDNEGTETYNQWLSLKRAEYIAREIQKKSRLSIDFKGYGSLFPLSRTDNSENRRVEIYGVH